MIAIESAFSRYEVTVGSVRKEFATVLSTSAARQQCQANKCIAAKLCPAAKGWVGEVNEVFTARPKMSTGTFSDYIKVHARIYTITEHVSISGAQSLSTRQEIHS